MDLTGQRYGRLTVLSLDRLEKARAIWLCQCDCGNQCTVKAGNLRRASTQSCGCFRRENSAKQSYRHGMTRSPEYLTWVSMIQRCENPEATAYEYYGGKGVTVFGPWHDFQVFLNDVGHRPEGKTLDRYPDPAGNYEPGNVRWATWAEQGQNKRLKFDL